MLVSKQSLNSTWESFRPTEWPWIDFGFQGFQEDRLTTLTEERHVRRFCTSAWSRTDRSQILGSGVCFSPKRFEGPKAVRSVWELDLAISSSKMELSF